nr:hypothetical protein GCM10025732_51210 [Glycomyces mayteni]
MSALETDPAPAAAPPPAPPVASLKGVAKSFGAVRALRGAHLDLYAGEAHALVGENGAGKSTLIKILAGLYRPDAGTVELGGEPVAFGDTAAAIDAGIAVIYQEPALFGDLSVAENLFIGRQPKGRFGLIDRAAMRRDAAALFARLGVPSTPTGPRRACRSPTSSSSRSPRPSPATPACSSWTSRPPRSPASRSSGSSGSCGPCARTVRRSCSSPTASTRSRRCASASP